MSYIEEDTIHEDGVPEEEDAPTYMIRRFWRHDPEKNGETIEEGLSLAEAREHCSNPDNKSDEPGNEWFDGFEKE